MSEDTSVGVPPGYDMLIDPAPPAGRPTTVLSLAADASVLEAANALEEMLRRDEALAAVLVIVGDMPVGITSRSFLAKAFERGASRLGEADRATQPGASTQYRLIRFRCTRCGRQVFRGFYDDRDLPVCAEPGHGAMALLR
jgi:hypothetical protein